MAPSSQELEPPANPGRFNYWYQIIRIALDGHPDQVDLDYHPKLDLPAASRYGASTPNLLTWFNKHNEDRPYDDQVRPSNFLLAYQIDPAVLYKCPKFLASFTDSSSSKAKTITLPKPVAPFDSDPAKAADKCFDRDTGIVIPPSVLKTYKDALAQYHLRPEHKFLNGNHADRGITRRRHVRAIAVRYIGKESNRWEEQYYLGANDSADIHYRLNLPEPKPLLVWVRERISEIGQRRVARESGLARRTIERVMQGKKIRDATIATLCGCVSR
jgi:hypothetical protein